MVTAIKGGRVIPVTQDGDGRDQQWERGQFPFTFCGRVREGIHFLFSPRVCACSKRRRR